MAAMETSYRKLFSLAVQHEYFGGGACPDLAVEPMGGTARVMRAYRMRLRAETGGAAVYIDSRNLTAEGLPKVPLAFALAVRNPTVYQYTALPSSAWPYESVAVFDNLAIFQGQILENAMLLAKPDDIKQMPVSGTGSDEVVSLDRPAAGVFGIVTIHLGQADSPPVPTAMKVLANGKPQEPRFVVSLAARRMRWRYLVAGAGDGTRIEASVSPPDEPIAFGAPTAAEVAGRNVQVFLSHQSYPVLSDPRGVYTAKLITNDGHERLLPLPSVASIKADGSSGGLVAEMVVMAERAG
jgi:hypothetical protein